MTTTGLALFGMALLQGTQYVLDPAGPQAAHISRLWWFMTITLTAIFVGVIVVLLVATFRRRHTEPLDLTPRSGVALDAARERRFTYVVAAATGLTTTFLFVFLLVDFQTGRNLYAISQPQAMTITVTGHQWWWEVDYNDPAPSRTLSTANEIHIPVGRPVLVRLRSADVIHSFWVPNLQGKMDLIPGHETATWIRADRPGTYRGQCGEFCGAQHAHMALSVVAESEEQFAAWYDAQLHPSIEASTPTQIRGRAVFLNGTCKMCHRIRGTLAGSNAGPDLTHVASRMTLAAGTLPNGRSYLSEWIRNAQGVKPGNHMPQITITAEDLDALVEYLVSLR